MCTGDVSYAEAAKHILIEYAKRYPGYEVHGDIPYNGPGKANAQTLCEAVFIRHFANAYDLVSEIMSEEEKLFICNDLLLCGANFLCQHRQSQIHNHEVIINAAIAVVGLIDNNNKTLLDFAIYDDYGLIYQLEKGMLSDGVWFECSLSYQLYALQNFYGFERFAIHTDHSQITHPNYRKMVKTALKFLQPDYKYPLMNDSRAFHTDLNEYNLYEFSYKQFGDEEILQAMHKVYEKEDRKANIEAFFYGVDELPEAGPMTFHDYHDADGSGTTIIRGKNKQYLLFRHGKFGGEHDHYDRLSVSYMYDNQKVIADLGTTGYGAFYHYEYFKNTGTHNTVMISEENQAPSDGFVCQYEKTDDHTFVSSKVAWTKDYQMPDSFTIPQWSDEAYQGVTMSRRIFKTEDYWIDIFNVKSKEDRQIDWVMHFGGQRLSSNEGEKNIDKLSDKKPFKYLKDATRLMDKGVVHNQYQLNHVRTDIYSYMDDYEMVYAYGPSIPTSTYIPYMIQRAYGKDQVFINVIGSYANDNKIIQKVDINIILDEIIIKVIKNNETKEHRFPKQLI